MKIAIGSDHAGYDLKCKLIDHLLAQGHEVVDVGADGHESVDYPVYGQKAAECVARGEARRGVVVCGTGIGISIAANKVKGVRAALCSEPVSAALCRQHNDANVLAMGARMIGEVMAMEILDTFLTTEFEGGRHQRRVDLIHRIEQ